MALYEMIAGLAPVWVAVLILAIGLIEVMGIDNIPMVDARIGVALFLVGGLLTMTSMGWGQSLFAADSGGDETQVDGVDYAITPTAISGATLMEDQDLFRTEQTFNESDNTIQTQTVKLQFTVQREDSSTDAATFNADFSKLADLQVTNESENEDYDVISDRSGTDEADILLESADGTQYVDGVFYTDPLDGSNSVTFNATLTLNKDAVQYGLDQFDSTEATATIAGQTYTYRELLANVVS